MQKYHYLLFDLDGTLTDPKIGITKCVAYALESFGIQVTDLDTLTCFIGPPLLDSFMEYYSFSEKEAAKAVEKYRERFSAIGILENSVYPGIEELLKKLTDLGFQLILATSKPSVYAKQILTFFHLESYFTFLSGSELDGRRTAKGEVIAYALEKCLITDRSQVLMIGDRKHDILGAKENKIDSMGVLFGYGTKEELLLAGADYIVESVEEMYHFFKKLSSL